MSDAEAAHDGGLRLRALIALGGALVHGVRGRDEEGAAVLHEALALAESTGDQGAAARAMRELGFIDVQAGRRQRADRWLSRAVSLADSEAELAAVLGNTGMNQSDMGRYADALVTLTRSVEHALAAGSTRQAAWSTSLIGRIHVLRGDTGSAVPALERSIELVREISWTAFAPWPESFRAEVDRAEGRRDRAADRYDHAFALACQLADPCWEGVAARGTGLLTADSGDVAGGMVWLTEAGSRCMRWPDAYQWVHAYVLDATCELAVSSGRPDAAQWVDRLAAVAARGEMNEFIVRSHAHRARLGQAGATAAAVQAAAAVDNPSLHVLVSSLDAPAPEGAPRVPIR